MWRFQHQMFPCYFCTEVEREEYHTLWIPFWGQITVIVLSWRRQYKLYQLSPNIYISLPQVPRRTIFFWILKYQPTVFSVHEIGCTHHPYHSLHPSSYLTNATRSPLDLPMVQHLKRAANRLLPKLFGTTATVRSPSPVLHDWIILTPNSHQGNNKVRKCCKCGIKHRGLTRCTVCRHTHTSCGYCETVRFTDLELR